MMTMATYKELLAEANKLFEQAEKQRVAELHGIIADVSSKIAEYKLTPEQCGFKLPAASKAAAATTPKAKGEPKYANPANPSETYAGGRGAKPKWMKEFLAMPGNKIDDLLIKK